MRSYSVDKPIIIKAHALKYFTNLASHQPSQNRTIHRKSPSPLPYERSVCFASCKTSGVQLRASMPVPCQREVDWRQGTNLNIIAFTCDMSTLFILQTFLPSRRRDCHTTNYASHQPLQNRTIPLAFRRGVGLPLPLHQSLLFSLIFVKEHLSLALLATPETSLQL